MQQTRKSWTLALTALGLFMVALDTLVVTTALPVLRVDLGAGLSDLEWTVNVYNLAFACFLLTGAALGDRFGRRRMFAIGLGVFTAASAAAALSPNVGTLIAARAVQGTGAALVMPLTLTLISAALSAAGLLGLTWALVRANTVGWGSAEVVATLAAGAALVAVFLAWERRARSPMLPLGLFRERGFSSANAVSFFMYAGLFGALFLMAQYLQTALGYSPLQAGIRLLPWTATPMVIAPIAGGLADRFGNRPFMILGLTMQAVGLGWVALIAKPDIGYLQLGIALTVAGVGTSLCFPTVANAVMGSVPPQEAGVASGTNSSLRELGGVFGVAVLAAVFTRHGVYASPSAFVDGFQPALVVGAALTAVGIVAAVLAPGRSKRAVAAAPGLAYAAEAD